MKAYEKGYFLLFNGISDMVQEMESTAQSEVTMVLKEELERRIIALRRLQQQAEELFISFRG